MMKTSKSISIGILGIAFDLDTAVEEKDDKEAERLIKKLRFWTNVLSRKIEKERR